MRYTATRSPSPAHLPDSRARPGRDPEDPGLDVRSGRSRDPGPPRPVRLPRLHPGRSEAGPGAASSA